MKNNELNVLNSIYLINIINMNTFLINYPDTEIHYSINDKNESEAR